MSVANTTVNNNIALILLCLFVALLLPLGAMLYLDILETKNQVKQELVKVEKLRRQVEQQQRKEKDK